MIPALWAIIGGSAAFLLNVSQDYILVAAYLVVSPSRRNGLAPVSRAVGPTRSCA
ncbi:hypothetical protein [Sinorhizobium medicae]|uniref:hypothetical protein n=1 Tax=Sinorhizobium medicae TaxID=110321 RepID=UPI003969D2D4